MLDDNTMGTLKSLHRAFAVILIGGLTATGWASRMSGTDDFLAAYTRKDYKTAWKLVQPMAEQGNSFAQFTVGKMYDNGEGISKDDRKAVEWYRKAADQGEALAQYQLGRHYANG